MVHVAFGMKVLVLELAGYLIAEPASLMVCTVELVPINIQIGIRIIFPARPLTWHLTSVDRQI